MTQASLNNLKTCLRGIGIHPMPATYSQPNNQIAQACSNSNHTQTNLQVEKSLQEFMFMGEQANRAASNLY